MVEHPRILQAGAGPMKSDPETEAWPSLAMARANSVLPMPGWPINARVFSTVQAGF
jgi:hypothetical protein